MASKGYNRPDGDRRSVSEVAVQQEFAARGNDDDQVHAVDAGPDAALDPSPYRTRCGQPVLEVYNTNTAPTCEVCAGQ